MALMHDEKNYLCPIFLRDCPFNQKSFMKKIQLGHQGPTNRLKVIGETVRVNLMNPGEFSHGIIKSTTTHITATKSFLLPKLSKIARSKSWNYGNSILGAGLISLSVILTFNYCFGICK